MFDRITRLFKRPIPEEPYIPQDFSSQGYRMWMYSPAPSGMNVALMRDDWESPYYTNTCDIHPTFNAYGLWWKPWHGETINGADNVVPFHRIAK